MSDSATVEEVRDEVNSTILENFRIYTDLYKGVFDYSFKDNICMMVSPSCDDNLCYLKKKCTDENYELIISQRLGINDPELIKDIYIYIDLSVYEIGRRLICKSGFSRLIDILLTGRRDDMDKPLLFFGTFREEQYLEFFIYIISKLYYSSNFVKKRNITKSYEHRFTQSECRDMYDFARRRFDCLFPYSRLVHIERKDFLVDTKIGNDILTKAGRTVFRRYKKNLQKQKLLIRTYARVISSANTLEIRNMDELASLIDFFKVYPGLKRFIGTILLFYV